jgi:hypothetical protein
VSSPAEWRTRLVQPLLSRVRSRLKVTAEPEGPQLARIGRILAWRATEVRWGPEAADHFQVNNDGILKVAMEQWGELPKLLGD